MTGVQTCALPILPAIVVFLNKIDQVKDKELIDLVETEIRELLTSYKFPGNKIPIIKGSALNAVEGKDEATGKKSILELMKAIDRSEERSCRERV